MKLWQSMFAVAALAAASIAYGQEAVGAGGETLPAEGGTANAAENRQEADPVVGAVPTLNPADFMQIPDSSLRDELRKVQRVAVGGFRVAFVTKAIASDSIRASYLGGGRHNSGINSKLEVTLRQIEAQRMQALTDRAYQEFVSQLPQLGLEILPYESVSAHPAFSQMNYAKHTAGAPYVVESGNRTYAFFTPQGQKLWFGQAEVLGDQGVFGTGNNIAAGEFAFENKAVVINPLLVVDFAETHTGKPKGFFNIRLSNKTEVGAKGGISLRSGQGMTELRFVMRSAPISMAVAVGAAHLKEPITIAGAFGDLVKREESSNRGLVVGLALLGLSGGAVRQSEKHDLMANPDKYQDLAHAALQAGGRLIVNTLAASRAGP